MNILFFQIIIIVLGIAVIGLYLPPLILTKTLNEGNAFGYVCAVGITAVGIFLNSTIEFLKTQLEANKMAAIIILLVISIIAFSFITAFFITLNIIIRHSKNSDEKRETVIILGCKIRGSDPSLALILRAKAAAQYLKKYPDAVAIASGGQGRDENLSEAQCIFNILTESGIDESRIFIEDKSTNTDENIRFSKKIIEENKLSENIAIATSDYHQYRASLICRKYGLTPCSVSAESAKHYKATYYTREVFGVWAEKL